MRPSSGHQNKNYFKISGYHYKHSFEFQAIITKKVLNFQTFFTKIQRNDFNFFFKLESVLFTSTLDLNLRKKLVKYYIWSRDLNLSLDRLLNEWILYYKLYKYNINLYIIYITRWIKILIVSATRLLLRCMVK